MKTDTELGKLFQENPSMLAELLNQEDKREYTVKSETFKEISRSADLCWYSETSAEARIIEIQGYLDPMIFHRGELERTLFSMRYKDKRVILTIIFLDPSFHPQTEPWMTHLRTGNPYYEVLYLDELLGSLAQRKPKHPLLSALAPLIIDTDEELRQQANRHYQLISNAQLPLSAQRSLREVFESLLITRFKNQTKEEFYQMLAAIGDIRESLAYKEIFAEGREAGLIEGERKGELKGKREGKLEGKLKGTLEGTIKTLDQLRKDGLLSQQEYETRVTPVKLKLEELKNSV